MLAAPRPGVSPQYAPTGTNLICLHFKGRQSASRRQSRKSTPTDRL